MSDQHNLINARVFHGDGTPRFIITEYEEVAPDVIEGRETEYNLGYVLERPIIIQPQKVSAQLQKSGRKVDWLQHLWFTGSITWAKLSWEVATYIFKAMQIEANTVTDGDFATTLTFKRFASDPYPIPITIIGDINIENAGGIYAFIGEKVTISFVGTQAWETTGLDITDYYYADSETDLRTWDGT